MRPRMLVMALLLTLWGMPQLSHAVPTSTVGSATVNELDTFTIPVSITDTVDLNAWQFDLAFDPTILQVTATGVTESAFFTQGDITVFVPGAVDNTLGQILGASDALILEPAVNGSGVLANIEFTAIAPGVSSLALSNVFLNQLNSGFTVTNGTVCVNVPTSPTCQSPPLPEPNTLALLAIGLSAFGARRRKARAWRKHMLTL
jgi:hypothetical protein